MIILYYKKIVDDKLVSVGIPCNDLKEVYDTLLMNNDLPLQFTDEVLLKEVNLIPYDEN